MASTLINAASARHTPAGRPGWRTRLAHAMGLSLCFTTLACAAQTSPVQGPGMPVPPPVAGGPAGGTQTIASPPPAPQPVRQSAIETGTVSRFVINPEGDVDGFLLGDGSLVHFPPHMSAQLVSAVHSGDSVKIAGVRDSAGNVSAQHITNERTLQQVVDQPAPVNTMRMPPELRGAGLVRLSVEGTVARVTTAPRGEPDGVMLSNGTIIKMPPPVAQQFASLMRPDVVVAASGYGTRNQYGEALQATAFGAPGKLTPLYNNTPN